jgi:hypothetical protein
VNLAQQMAVLTSEAIREQQLEAERRAEAHVQWKREWDAKRPEHIGKELEAVLTLIEKAARDGRNEYACSLSFPEVVDQLMGLGFRVPHKIERVQKVVNGGYVWCKPIEEWVENIQVTIMW